jgi:hypothetical protein
MMVFFTCIWIVLILCLPSNLLILLKMICLWGVALLPYKHSISNEISRLLAKYKIKKIHMPLKKTITTLRLVMDSLRIKTPNV